MPFSVNSDEGVSRIICSDPNDGSIPPMNCLIVASPGGGKTMAEESLVNLFYNNGYTIISLSDVKDSYEQAFCMFPPEARYHLRKLRKFGCPIGGVPTKLYHPFTFRLPKNTKVPDIHFYTLNIKTLTRTDMGYLAESDENKRSIQIILDELEKLKRGDTITHLVFNSENQTESVANLVKSGVRFRSDDPDSFYTRAKQGTEKTSSELISYFKPFLTDYALAPADCPHNLNIVEVMNDQEHYHIFSTRWIPDQRLKNFFILHLLQDILNNETHAKHPVLLIVEEIRFLTPDKNEGFHKFLAEQLKNTMTRMRNMGKGFGIAATTQVYGDVHRSVADTFNEIVFGRITSLKELENIGKALKLTTQDTNLLKSLGVGDFVIKTKDEFSDEPSLQKIKFFMPMHAHKEQGYSFFEWYEKKKPESMRTLNDLIDTMRAIKQRGEIEVALLKDKENEAKKNALKFDREEKQQKEKNRAKEQVEKIKQTLEKKEDVTEKIKELIYTEYQNATGKDKSLRNLAKKFNLYLKSGEPNSMAIKRAVEQVERKKKTQNENFSSAPTPDTAPPQSNDEEVDENLDATELLDEKNDNSSDDN